MISRFSGLAAAVVTIMSAASAAEPGHLVARVDVDDRRAVIGTVETLREVSARARIGGTIAQLLVREGDRIAAGGRVALVVDEKLALQVLALDARIQAQQAQRDQARIDFDRAEDLRRSGTVAQARVDEARTRLDVAERTLRAVRAEREVLLQQSAEGAVLSPGPGRILRVPVNERSVVLAGDTIATIATDAYVLRLRLPERHARSLKAGDTILVGARGLQAAGMPETLRSGRVVLVYPQIDQGRVVADVEVDGLGDYFVGERTRVYVSTGTRSAFVVPPELVVRRHGVDYVRLADGTDVVVQVGSATDRGVEILAGLRDGDRVIKP
jgi:multidrug efflux system membrane fusion protein